MSNAKGPVAAGSRLALIGPAGRVRGEDRGGGGRRQVRGCRVSAGVSEWEGWDRGDGREIARCAHSLARFSRKREVPTSERRAATGTARRRGWRGRGWLRVADERCDVALASSRGSDKYTTPGASISFLRHTSDRTHRRDGFQLCGH